MKSGDHGNYIHSHKSVTSVHSCENTECTTSGNALAQASRGHTIMLLPVLKPSCHVGWNAQQTKTSNINDYCIWKNFY